MHPLLCCLRREGEREKEREGGREREVGHGRIIHSFYFDGILGFPADPASLMAASQPACLPACLPGMGRDRRTEGQEECWGHFSLNTNGAFVRSIGDRLRAPRSATRRPTLMAVLVRGGGGGGDEIRCS